MIEISNIRNSVFKLLGLTGPLYLLMIESLGKDLKYPRIAWLQVRNTGAFRLLSQLSLPMLELLFVAPVPKSFEIMTPSTVGLCCSNLHLALLASFLPPGKNHVSSSKLSVLLPCCYDQLYHSPHTPQYELWQQWVMWIEGARPWPL